MIRTSLLKLNRASFTSTTRLFSVTEDTSEKLNKLYALLPEWKDIGSKLVSTEKHVNADDFSISELINAGMHLGHSYTNWHPNMLPYIYGRRAGIHIINLEHTLTHLRRAMNVTREIARNGGVILFVGMRQFMRDILAESARDANQFYVHGKWLHGCLANHEQTLKAGTKGNGFLQPDLVVFLDMNEAKNAMDEASRLYIPTIGLADTDCDPMSVTYPIPGNDDAHSSVKLVAYLLSNAAKEGRAVRMEAMKKVMRR